MKKSKLLSKVLLILLSMCIYSCYSSDDDDNINDNPNLDSSNFLEKFDGFGYFYESDYNDTDFWFFKNNPNGNYLNSSIWTTVYPGLKNGQIIHRQLNLAGSFNHSYLVARLGNSILIITGQIDPHLRKSILIKQFHLHFHTFIIAPGHSLVVIEGTPMFFL